MCRFCRERMRIIGLEVCLLYSKLRKLRDGESDGSGIMLGQAQ